MVWVVLVRAAAGVALVLAYRLGAAARRATSGGGGLAVAGVALAGGFALEAARGRRGAARDRGRAGRDRVLARRAAARGAGAGRRVRAAAGGGVAVPRARGRGGVAARPGARGRCSARWRWLVPAAWFVPEWLGSGDVLRSGARARIPNPGQPALADVPALASLWAAAELLLVPLWLGRRRSRCASPGRGRSRRRAAAWVALVAAMAQAGFSRRAALRAAGRRAARGGRRRRARAGARPAARRRSIGLSPIERLLGARGGGGGGGGAGGGARARGACRACAPPRRTSGRWRATSARPCARPGGREAVLACGRPYVGPVPRAADGLRAARAQAHGRARRRAAGARRRLPRAAHRGGRARPAGRPAVPRRRAGRASGRSCAAARAN